MTAEEVRLIAVVEELEGQLEAVRSDASTAKRNYEDEIRLLKREVTIKEDQILAKDNVITSLTDGAELLRTQIRADIDLHARRVAAVNKPQQ